MVFAIDEIERALHEQAARKPVELADDPSTEWVDASAVIYKHLAAMIVAARKDQKISSSQLAKRLRVPASAISDLERGAVKTPERLFKRAAKVLNIDFSCFFLILHHEIRLTTTIKADLPRAVLCQSEAGTDATHGVTFDQAIHRPE